ncbi:MAG: hypothetical protein HRU22_04575 [Gammaproteobacteria bacterium]|nr:hypothetical protein [Gammaproteobacteria bacterium]
MPKVGYNEIRTATRSITDYINGYYNKYRPHQFNEGLSPIVAEKGYLNNSNKMASFS